MSEPYDPSPAQDRRGSWRSLSGQKRGQHGQSHEDAHRAGLGLDQAPPRGHGAPAQSAQSGAQAPSTNPQIARLQAEIDDTVGIMHKNIEGMVERQEHLDSVRQKTDNLSVASMTFRKKAGDVRRQMWWKNMKWWLILGGVIIFFIIAGVVGGIKGKEIVHVVDNATSTDTQPDPANGSHDSPVAAAKANTGPGREMGTGTGLGLGGGLFPPPGAAPVTVARRDVDTPKPNTRIRSTTALDEGKEKIYSEDGQVEEVEGRDAQIHAPPPSDSTSKRGGHIGVESRPTDNHLGKLGKRGGVIGVESAPGGKDKRDHTREHNDQSDTQEPKLAAGEVAEGEAHVQLIHRSLADQAEGSPVADRRSRKGKKNKGHALPGAFGRRTAQGKRWFMVDAE